MDPFIEIPPQGREAPVVVTVPHSGTLVPAEFAGDMDPRFVSSQPDTDWLVDELWEFAPSMGITLIKAPLSRYVIDLNRDPAGSALYADGRRETSLVPTFTFGGEPIYRTRVPDAAAIKDRLERCYWPWYRTVQSTLERLRAKHGVAVLFDAHSIQRHVPSIRTEPFPDMILGTRDGKSAAPEIIEAALNALRRGGKWNVAHNDPFKGGHITRWFAKPSSGIHALQLEMSQDIYMQDRAPQALDQEKLKVLRPGLKQLLETIAATAERFK
jgi:N-formylglutamate deformylase